MKLTQEDLQKSLVHKGITNVQLIKGNILDTLPQYCEENKGQKIALLHIDVDVYEPTVVALEYLYDRVVVGGLIVLDDYGTVEGETKAVDEFLEKYPHKINKFSFSHKKPSYIIKK